jgi:hypothetical protein
MEVGWARGTIWGFWRWEKSHTTYGNKTFGKDQRSKLATTVLSTVIKRSILMVLTSRFGSEERPLDYWSEDCWMDLYEIWCIYNYTRNRTPRYFWLKSNIMNTLYTGIYAFLHSLPTHIRLPTIPSTENNTVPLAFSPYPSNKATVDVQL